MKKSTVVVKFKGEASATVYDLGGTYSLALSIGRRRAATFLFDKSALSFTGKGHLFLRKGERP